MFLRGEVSEVPASETDRLLNDVEGGERQFYGRARQEASEALDRAENLANRTHESFQRVSFNGEQPAKIYLAIGLITFVVVLLIIILSLWLALVF